MDEFELIMNEELQWVNRLDLYLEKEEHFFFRLQINQTKIPYHRIH